MFLILASTKLIFPIDYIITGKSCQLPTAPAILKNPAPKRLENQILTKINDDYLPPKQVLR